MAAFTVLATPRSFAAGSAAPLRLLEEAGCRVLRLPGGGKDFLNALADCDAVIAGLESYPREILGRAARLKVISRYGTGCDGIDLDAARELGIAVTNTPGANAESVADLAFALMLCCARHICPMDAALRAGQEEKPRSGTLLYGKTLGVVGTGRIGKGVIARAAGFSMRILAYDPYPDYAFLRTHRGEYTDLDTLFRQADFISLHCPLTTETAGLADERRLGLMKREAILVNTARGGLVDEDALCRTLYEGRIAGAALDATNRAPLRESPLLMVPNCILTPHAGAATREAGERMGLMAAQNALDVLQGRSCPFRIV